MPKLSRILLQASKFCALAGLVFLIISFAPSVWYNLIAGGTEKVSRLLSTTVPEGNTVQIKKSNYQPRFDPSLPKQSRLKINSIRIDTAINEAPFESFEEALKLGVWRVPDFGTPDKREKPMILAAHRFGYLKWSIAYRLKNSFYSLPKLKTGSVVEVIWQQRKYVYAVYGEDKGETPTDYSADLILYTCESLNSPVRIFKYARLLEI